MRFFVKSIATGFALSLGGALFRKVSKRIGLDEDSKSEDPVKKVVDTDSDGEIDSDSPRHN